MMLERDNSLEGKTVMVTGGASGLGEALCRLLAASGASVMVSDLNGDKAAALARSLRALGQRADATTLDVADAEAAQAAVDAVIARWGRLDILINNAGTDVTLPLSDISPQAWQRVIGTNLNGPFYLSRGAAAHMMAAGAGHIVNIASTAAVRAWPNASAYHASKWGLLGLSRALHAELRPHGVKVTTVIAGGMRTPFLLDRFPDIDPETLQDPMNAARAIHAVLLMPAGSVVAELTVLPLGETSWP